MARLYTSALGGQVIYNSSIHIRRKVTILLVDGLTTPNLAFYFNVHLLHLISSIVQLLNAVLSRNFLLTAPDW